MRVVILPHALRRAVLRLGLLRRGLLRFRGAVCLHAGGPGLGLRGGTAREKQEHGGEGSSHAQDAARPCYWKSRNTGVPDGTLAFPLDCTVPYAAMYWMVQLRQGRNVITLG